MRTAHANSSDSSQRSATVKTEVSLNGMSGKKIVADVVECGTGTPVVFLHGLVGLNEHWELVVHSLSKRARCVTLEMPLLSLRKSDCSIQAVSAMTMQFIDKHFDQPVVLVGNSFGGHVALRVAHERPELVRSLVLG